MRDSCAGLCVFRFWCFSVSRSQCRINEMFFYIPVWWFLVASEFTRIPHMSHIVFFVVHCEALATLRLHIMLLPFYLHSVLYPLCGTGPTAHCMNELAKQLLKFTSNQVTFLSPHQLVCEWGWGKLTAFAWGQVRNFCVLLAPHYFRRKLFTIVITSRWEKSVYSLCPCPCTFFSKLFAVACVVVIISPATRALSFPT